MTLLMQIVCAADGKPTPFDGKYLKAYDPEQDGVSPDGRIMQAYIEVTDNPIEARKFRTLYELAECWRQVSKREPVRPDGMPNRPLTFFTVVTENYPLDTLN